MADFCAGMSTFSTRGGLYERAQKRFAVQDGKKLFTFAFFEKQRLEAMVGTASHALLLSSLTVQRVGSQADGSQPCNLGVISSGIRRVQGGPESSCKWPYASAL